MPTRRRLIAAAPLLTSLACLCLTACSSYQPQAADRAGWFDRQECASGTVVLLPTLVAPGSPPEAAGRAFDPAFREAVAAAVAPSERVIGPDPATALSAGAGPACADALAATA